MEKVYIKDKQNNKVLPITHVSAVLDDQGNDVGSIIGTFEDEVRGLVDTPHQNYVTVSATSLTTSATSVLPASGQSADTIYRVANWDGSTNSGAGSFDVTKYSEYAWDDVSTPAKYVFLCVKSQIGEVFDITVYNNNTKYVDLAAALGNGGANVPQELQRGGMSVKYVQTSDNKYVQYRLMAQNFSADEADWQGVDNKPIAGSKNLVESGGAKNGIDGLRTEIIDQTFYPTNQGYVNANGTVSTDSNAKHTDYIYVGSYSKLTYRTLISLAGCAVAFYDSSRTFMSDASIKGSLTSAEVTIDIPSGASYVILSEYNYANARIILFGGTFEDKVFSVIEGVQDSVSDLQSETEGLQSDVIAIEQRLDDVTITPEKTGYVKTDGGIDPDSNARHTDYIPLASITKIKYRTNMGATGWAISFYNSSKTLMSDVSVATASSSTEVAINVPEGAAYLILSEYNYPSAYVTTFVDFSLDDIKEELVSLEKKIADQKYIPGETGYIKANGGVDLDGNAKHTDYISLDGIQKITYKTNMGSTGCAVAFYDSSKEFMSDVSVKGASSSSEVTMNIPDGAYYAILSEYNYPSAYIITITGTSLEDRITDLENIGLFPDNAFGAFLKFGVVGDSLSAGHIKANDGTNYGRNIPYSWGQNLARNLGNKCLVFAKTGMTAKSWMSDSLCYSSLIISDNLCQCYVIGLGMNDWEQIRDNVGTYSDGVGTTADINFSDMTQNADSFCGWYARVINTVNTYAPNAMVFTLMMPYPVDEIEEAIPVNNAIKAVSALSGFSNVACIDLSEYDDYYKGNGLANQKSGGHFSAIGYANAGMVIATAISKYMNTHRVQYQDLFLIPYGNNDINP